MLARIAVGAMALHALASSGGTAILQIRPVPLQCPQCYLQPQQALAPAWSPHPAAHQLGSQTVTMARLPQTSTGEVEMQGVLEY